MTTINKLVQYAFGFSYLGGRSVYRFAEKVVKGTFKNVHSIFPFLSQLDLLNWSKKVIDGVDGIYDKAMDAEYLRTHIGGANHRIFDGGHDLISAWKRVRDASGTDTFSQEVIGYVSAIWKDVTTPMGLPFSTWNKENYDHWAEWTKNTIPGANKKWFSDLNVIYSERRELVWELATALNCTFDTTTSGMFVWAKLPAGLKSEAFIDKILNDHHLFIAPGTIFGTNGEG